MLIFKEIERAIKAVKRELSNSTENSQKELATRKFEALMEILNYIKEGKWATTQKAKERMLYAMQNGNEEAAKKFETTVPTIKASISQYSTTIRNIIGADTIQLIQEGNVEIGLIQFRCNTGTLSMTNLLVNDTMDAFTKIYDVTQMLRLADCKLELRFLHKYLNSSFQKDLEKCDKTKLAFLKWLLEKDTASIYERSYLVQYLTNEITFEELSAKLGKLE